MLKYFVLSCLLASTPSVIFADDANTAALKQQVIDAAGGETKLMRLFRMKDRLKVGYNPDKPAKERTAVLEPPAHWWMGKRDRVVASQEPATYLVWAWTLGALTDEASQLELLTEVRDGDVDLVGIRVTESITPAMDLYFDKQTHLLTRIDWRTDIHRFSEWKDFDGVTYPSKCLGYKKTAKKPWYQCEILELKVLKELPDGLERKEPAGQ